MQRWAFLLGSSVVWVCSKKVVPRDDYVCPKTGKPQDAKDDPQSEKRRCNTHVPLSRYKPIACDGNSHLWLMCLAMIVGASISVFDWVRSAPRH